MPRGYRHIVAALAGLILIGASGPAKQQASPKQAGAEQTQPKRQPPILPLAAQSAQPVKPPEKARPCEGGQHTGNDDLCIQWKSADAAAEAAEWAYWQMIFSGLGIIGLGITLWFNLDAWRQARDARDDAQQSMELAREQSRARVTLLPSNFTLPTIVAQSEITPEMAPNRPTVVLQFQNSGKSEAMILEVRANHVIGNQAPDEPPFHKTPIVHIADLTIGAESVSEHKTIWLENLPSAGEISQIRNGWYLVYFYGLIRYEDIFGIEHVTSWCMRSETDGTYRYWGGEKYNFRT